MDIHVHIVDIQDSEHICNAGNGISDLADQHILFCDGYIDDNCKYKYESDDDGNDIDSNASHTDEHDYAYFDNGYSHKHK